MKPIIYVAATRALHGVRHLCRPRMGHEYHEKPHSYLQTAVGTTANLPLGYIPMQDRLASLPETRSLTGAGSGR